MHLALFQVNSLRRVAMGILLVGIVLVAVACSSSTPTRPPESPTVSALAQQSPAPTVPPTATGPAGATATLPVLPTVGTPGAPVTTTVAATRTVAVATTRTRSPPRLRPLLPSQPACQASSRLTSIAAPTTSSVRLSSQPFLPAAAHKFSRVRRGRHFRPTVRTLHISIGRMGFTSRMPMAAARSVPSSSARASAASTGRAMVNTLPMPIRPSPVSRADRFR